MGSSAKDSKNASDSAQALGRTLAEVSLNESIRYRNGDSVESWLNQLLCLDATLAPPIPSGCPSPSNCDLYYVDRDALFSYDKASEGFLQRVMALMVSSHYKNTPNDLQMLSDAPAHHLFVLLGKASFLIKFYLKV
jgi:N-acetyltransferase 10